MASTGRNYMMPLAMDRHHPNSPSAPSHVNRALSTNQTRGRPEDMEMVLDGPIAMHRMAFITRSLAKSRSSGAIS